jgi:hypothetical protein
MEGCYFCLHFLEMVQSPFLILSLAGSACLGFSLLLLLSYHIFLEVSLKLLKTVFFLTFLLFSRPFSLKTSAVSLHSSQSEPLQAPSAKQPTVKQTMVEL